MLNTLDLDRSLDKATYETQIEELMRQLRSLQQACWEKKLTFVVVLEGWAAAGKGKLLKQMVDHMDPRGFSVYPTLPPTPAEQQYPFLWRFWQNLPSHGSIGIFYHSWYIHLLEDRLFDRIDKTKVSQATATINAFERQLNDDGVAIAKFFLHIGRKELKKRLKKASQDDLTAWRVRPEDWHQEECYKEYRALSEEMLLHTSTGVAPWILVEANCKYWARIKVLSQLVAVLREALDRTAIPRSEIVASPQEKLLPTEPDYLEKVDLSLNLDRNAYKKRLRKAQIELQKLQLKIHQEKIPVVLVFEGWDAAGKGGAIKRLTDSLDPRSYKVNAYAAPTHEEKQYHYLWRFWRRLPEVGKFGIFDRSWYGRVLVERVEGFATEGEWRRAYREINEFESQLASDGCVVVKFWLHLSREEQLRRFEDRKENPFKAYKLTEEDWRNREKWNLYEVAVNHAIARTSTPAAPWTIVPGDDKYYARVFVLETVIEAIEAKLKAIRKS